MNGLARAFLRYRGAWLAAFDALAIAVVWLVVVGIRSRLGLHADSLLAPLNPWRHYLAALPWIIGCYLLVCWFCGLYSRRDELFSLAEIRSILLAIFIFAGCVVGVGYYTKATWDLGRSVVTGVIVANALVLPASRLGLYLLAQRLLRRGFGRLRTAVIGVDECARTVWKRLAARPLALHQLAGYLAPQPLTADNSAWAGCAWLGRLEDLPQLIFQHQLDEICFADPTLSLDDTLNIIARCGRPGVRFMIATRGMFEVYVNQAVDLEEIDGVPVVTLANSRPGLLYHCIRRTLDLVGALLLALPTLALIPLLRWTFQRRGLRASVVFRQNRAGLHGRPFMMFKFRTMFEDVDEYAQAPIAPGDPRVIPGLGAWLRRTSLDELPQCFNVLRGEMSLVGPRPEMPFIVARYQPWQQRRMTVKPGITGLWQVLGRKDLPLNSNLEYDFYYIQNQSLLLDLMILLKTLPVVLFGHGAY